MVRRPPGQHLEGLRTVVGATRLVALVLQRPLKGVGDGGVVLCHQDAGTGHGCGDRSAGWVPIPDAVQDS